MFDRLKLLAFKYYFFIIIFMIFKNIPYSTQNFIFNNLFKTASFKMANMKIKSDLVGQGILTYCTSCALYSKCVIFSAGILDL